MSSPALHELSLQALAEQLQSQHCTAQALAQHFLDRAQAQPSAFAAQNPEATLAQAQAADARLAAGEQAPLLGLPLAYADNLVSCDWPTSAGSRILAGYRSPFDAAAIAQMQAAGAVGLGKTQVAEFGLTVGHAPSAQSGAAQAVAQGLAPAAVAVDTGGSLLQAATQHGLVGFKPSFGRISRFGVVALISSCEQVGTLSRNAADAALLLQQLCQADTANDNTSFECPPEDFARHLGQSLAGLKIASPSAQVLEQLDPTVRQATEAALDKLQSLGAQLQPTELPQLELAAACLELLGAAEASSNLARYDGVRFGHRSAQSDKLDDLYTHSRSEGFGPAVQRYLILGNHVLAEAHIQSHYFQAQKVRRLITQELQNALAGCAALALPVAASTSPAPDRLAANRYTAAAALAGLPALSLPIGHGPSAPVGLQLIGPYFGEAQLLQIAAQFQA